MDKHITIVALTAFGIFVFLVFYYFIPSIDSTEFEDWFSTPVTEMKIADIIVILAIFSCFTRNKD